MSAPPPRESAFESVAYAPGHPGIAPTWTSSAKDIVSTALGPSRVWATIGYGILNEVYWPWTGEPQLRDLGFIVADEHGWQEVKRVRNYTIDLPLPYVPLGVITHVGDGYTLELRVVPDPRRDTVVIAYRLNAVGKKLYVLLAPHLGGSGGHNNARAGTELVAWKDDAAMCVMADSGFARASAGYVGVSDGWQDFDRNGAMTWAYPLAEDGNVALLGELGAIEGVIALGLADTIVGAHTLAASSLTEGFDTIRRYFVHGWETWGRMLDIPEAPPAIERAAYLSACVLRAHGDRTYPGAIVASLSIPWGNTSDSTAGYHLVWTRDTVESSLALLAIGQREDARHTLAYLTAIQRADGGWSQNCFPNGEPFWAGEQLDEVGFPILLAAKLKEEDELRDAPGTTTMVRQAAAYLAKHGPISPQDRWEENAGVSPFTLGIVICALVAACEFLDAAEREYLASLADYWNARIEDWTYSERGSLSARFGVDGYYVRIGPTPAIAGLRGRIDLRNRGAQSIEVDALVGMEFLYLVRLGLRAATDPRICNTIKVSDGMLAVATPQGVAYRRYNEDGYGEHDDGSAFNGTGVGRAWPLLTGERGHYELMLGHDPLPYLETMNRMTGRGGLMPEQVWDAAPIPERDLVPGKPTGSAMPLVWAHAEFLKLLVARERKRPVELLRCVERRYAGARPDARTWHWREDLPIIILPAGRDLVVDGDAAFVLHVGFDGWSGITDMTSTPLALGRHGVRLPASLLDAHQSVEFTRYFAQTKRWEGVDHQVSRGDTAWT
jgi:glucoamylase